MNPAGNDPLAQLRDVHLPPDPGWWPPAIGWWLAALACLMVIAGAVLLIRWLRRPTLFRDARRELDRIASQVDDAGFEPALAAWFRRFMVVRDGPQTAGLTGDDWLNQLERSAPDTPIQPVWEQLFVQRYQPAHGPLTDRETLLATCHQWCREALR